MGDSSGEPLYWPGQACIYWNPASQLWDVGPPNVVGSPANLVNSGLTGYNDCYNSKVRDANRHALRDLGEGIVKNGKVPSFYDQLKDESWETLNWMWDCTDENNLAPLSPGYNGPPL